MAKQLSEETLQIAEKRREVKGKRVKERYTHLNAEFKEQQGEIRKSSSMMNAKKQRKTLERERLEISSRKLEIPREYFMQRWAQYNRSDMDLTEAEDIKRGGKNTQKNYTKKILMNSDNHNAVITHLEPDILECEIKWALGKHRYKQS